MLLLFIALLACKRPAHRGGMEEKIPPPFLKATLAAGKINMAFALSFPPCAYQSGFGPGNCSHVLCRATYNGKRTERMERRVCKDFETHEIPRLAGARSERERQEALERAAANFATAHNQFATDRGLKPVQQVITHPERLPEFVDGTFM